PATRRPTPKRGARPQTAANAELFDKIVAEAITAQTKAGEGISEARARGTFWPRGTKRLKLERSRQTAAALMRSPLAQLVAAEKLGVWRYVRLYPGEIKMADLAKRLRTAG